MFCTILLQRLHKLHVSPVIRTPHDSVTCRTTWESNHCLYQSLWSLQLPCCITRFGPSFSWQTDGVTFFLVYRGVCGWPNDWKVHRSRGYKTNWSQKKKMSKLLQEFPFKTFYQNSKLKKKKKIISMMPAQSFEDWGMSASVSSAYLLCKSGSEVSRGKLSFYKNTFKCFGLAEHELISRSERPERDGLATQRMCLNGVNEKPWQHWCTCVALPSSRCTPSRVRFLQKPSVRGKENNFIGV